MAEITFDGVTKIFGDDIRAVDELSLHVDDGDSWSSSDPQDVARRRH